MEGAELGVLHQASIEQAPLGNSLWTLTLDLRTLASVLLVFLRMIPLSNR